MPMYRAFAPFFKGDRGDRRVTALFTAAMHDVRRRFMRAEGWQRIDKSFHAPEFSREFDCRKPPKMCEVAFYV